MHSLGRRGNSPSTQTSPPALAADEVAARRPLDLVPATGKVGVRGRGAAISPPRVEEAVVRALRAGRALPLLHREGPLGILGRSRDGPGRDEQDGKEGSDCDHGCLLLGTIDSLVCGGC
jgi:hypothetical protein